MGARVLIVTSDSPKLPPEGAHQPHCHIGSVWTRRAFWEALSPEQREAFQDDALKHTPPIRTNKYRPLKDMSTPAAAAFLNAILKEHFYKSYYEELPTA